MSVPGQSKACEEMRSSEESLLQELGRIRYPARLLQPRAVLVVRADGRCSLGLLGTGLEELGSDPDFVQHGGLALLELLPLPCISNDQQVPMILNRLTRLFAAQSQRTQIADDLGLLPCANLLVRPFGDLRHRQLALLLQTGCGLRLCLLVELLLLRGDLLRDVL